MSGQRAAGVTVRPAGAGDIGRLAELFGQLGPPVSSENVAAQLARMTPDRDAVLVAELAGVPVGVACVSATPFPNRGVARARLTALVVDAKARGGGIGAILVAAAEEAGRAMGCGVLELTSGAGRLDAHRFYQREGFRSTSVRFSKDL